MKKYIFSIVLSALILIAGVVLMIISNDERDLSYPSGFLVGFGAVLLAVSLLSLKRSKDNPNVICYDERQLKARGDAFKISFFTLVFLLLSDGIIRKITGYDWISFFDGVLIHIIISIGVFVNYSIFKDAYLEINSNSKRFSIILLVFGAYNLIFPIFRIIDNTFIENGMMSIGLTNLITSILCFSIIISLIIKNQIDKKKENEEEEEYYEES